MSITQWMSWEGGVDLCAATQPGLDMPNVLIHVARMVHTPQGSAPSGMILFQPDPGAAPAVIGFISADAALAQYFGPNIFAGTPFEGAPCQAASIEVSTDLPGTVGSRVEVGGHVFETTLTGLGALATVERAPGGATPFTQFGLEAVAATATLSVDGADVPLLLPPVGISGGAPAVWAASGIYAR